MKTLKRIVSVVLAFLMLFSSVSILSSAVVGDGNENSFTLTTKFYREDPDSGEWIETSKAAKGEDILARVYLKTDYYASDHTLFWLYPSDFMTFKTSNYKKQSGLYVSRNGKISFENYDDDDSMANLYYWEGVSVVHATEPGGFATGDFADLLVSEGYMSATDFENKSWLALQMDMLDPDIGAVEASDDYYLYQILFTVNDDATGVGTLQTPEAAILTPDRPKATLNIKKYPDPSDITFGYTMKQFQADWTLNQDATVSTQSIFTFNVDGTATEKGADIGGLFGDTNSIADPAIGKVFVGWDDAATEAVENYSSADIEAMEVGYEDMAFNAVFEAAEATYGVKVVEQKPDGSWPTDGEIAAIEAKSFDSKLNEVISAADYAPVPAGFSISNPTDTITVDATDNDILIVKLARNTVTVTFEGEAVTGLYGSTQTAPKKNAGDGYTNEGWYTADGVKIADNAGTFTMPAEAAAYVSNVVADKQDVTVNVTYFDAFADKLVTVPVTFEDVTATGRNVKIASYNAGEEDTDYILIDEINAKANLEHYQYDALSASNNLEGKAGANGLTLTVGYAPKSYRVTFNTNVIGTKNVNAQYGHTITEAQIGFTKAQMEEAKPGYTFEGWYLDVDDETTKFVPGETQVSGPATYIAKFTADQVKVNYVFAGDEGHGVANPYPNGKTAIYDDVVEIPVIEAPAGWSFKWTVDGAINYGEVYRVGEQDVTVTGTWTRNSYTITYYYDNNKVATVFPQPTELKFGDAIPTDLTAAQAGKLFTDWTYELENGDLYTGSLDKMPAHNLVAIADFQDIQYTVQFMKYDDIVGDEEDVYPLGSDQAIYRGTIDEVPDTEEEGYIFTGWEFEDGTSANFPYEVVFQDENGAYLSVPEDGNWTLVGNAATAKVYATYSPKIIDVTFDPAGGYFVIDGVKVTDAQVLKTEFGAEILKPENDWNIARDGYTFMMWDLPFSEGDTVQSEEAEYNTYTAEWLPNVEYVFAGEKVPVEVHPIEAGVDENRLITIPTYAVDGYKYDVTISGAVDNGDGTFNMGTIPVTVTYTWRADNHVAYTVNTWFAKVGSAEYEAGEALVRYGTTGETITLSDADKTAYEGFEFSKLEPADKAITGDGLAEVNAYFTRKMVDVVVKDGKGETIIDTEVQYGATLTKPTETPDAVNPGEEFDKWVDEAGNEIDWNKPVDTENPIVINPIFKKINYNVTYATAGDVPAGYELPNAEYKNLTEAHYGDSVKVPAWNNDTVPGYNVAYTVTGANGAEGAYTVGEGDVTVTATWSKDLFKVTYVTNGNAPAGYTLPANVTNATIGTAVEIPAWVAQGAPAGYTLGFEVTGANKLNDNSYEVYNSDVTVTATWNYVNYTVDYVTVGTAPEGYELPADINNAIIGTTFEVPNWNNDTVPGYNVTIDVKNANLKDGVYSVDTSDVTVTATWTYDKYTIDYVTAGDAPAGYELPADVADAIIGTEVVIPDWATAAAPAGYTMKLDVVGAVDGKVYDKDVTVTVTWEYVPYTVTYSYDATAPAGAVVPGVENVHIGEVITLATPAAVDGYTFNGWIVTGATKNDDGTYTVGAENIIAIGSWTALSTTFKVQRWYEIVGQDGQYAADENILTIGGTAGQIATYDQAVKGFNLVKVDPADAIINGNGSTLISVYYDRKDITVTYLDEAGKPVSTETVQFGADIQKPEDAVSEDSGMKFTGWVYEDGTPVTWPIKVTEETSLAIKPNFEANTYMVRFMTDAENVYAYDTLAYKASIAKPTGVPVKTGYQFVEWRKGGVNGAAWAETDTVPANNVDYYAYFAARTDITYEIDKYFQAVGSTGWDDATFDFETVANATIGEKITLNLDDYVVPGFTIDTEKSIYKDVEVEGDNSTKLVLYYTRNNVTVKVNGEDVTLPAGDTITKTELEEIIKDTKDDGYNYVEWKDENGDVVKFPYTVPATGGSLTPTVEPRNFIITFVDKDGNEVDVQTVPYKSTIVAPAYPEVEGYKPTGWYNVADNTAMPETVPATNATYKVAYTNSTNTAYAITIYMMDLAGEYTIKTTTAAYGTTGDEVRIIPQSYTGLYEDTTHPDRNLTDVIAANGSTELRIFYARSQYEVTFDGGEASKVYYGAALPKAADPEKVGQKFTGWTDADGKALKDYAAMPDKNLAFTSNWEDVYYTITYVVNGVQTPVKYKYGEAIADPETPNEPGMTFTGWLPEVPETMDDKDLIIVAQFSTAYYTVKYLNDVDGDVFAEYTVMFGQEIPVPEEKPTKAYHKFVEWIGVPATMPSGDITIVPKFERENVKLVPQDGSTTVIDPEEMIIYGLKTTLSESILRNQFLKVEGDGYIIIKEAYGEPGFYGTGAKVELYDNADPSGQPIEVYTIIVFGDLNGDARINATDDSIICQEIAATNFDDIWSYDILPGYDKYKVMAADLNRDGLVNATDRSTISNITLGSEMVDQKTREIIRADA